MEGNNRKISRYDERSINHVRSNQEQYDTNFRFFGETLLEQARELQAGEYSQEQLDALEQDAYEHFHSFFLPVLTAQPHVRDEILDILFCNPKHQHDTELYAFLDNPSLESYTSQKYLKFLQWYTHNCALLQTRFEKSLTGSLADTFLQQIDKLIDNEELPLSKEEVRKRLELVRVRFNDPLSLCLDGANGLYYMSLKTIELKIAKHDRMYSDFAHETVHALEGTTLVAKTGHSDLDNVISITRHRSGLEWHGDLSLRWMNEAITELYATRLRGKKFNNAYTDEIKLFQALLTKGKFRISFYRAAEAYFEDDVGDNPAWDRFFKQIEDSYYKGFLEALSEIITEKGIKAGMRYFEEYIQDQESDQLAA